MKSPTLDFLLARLWHHIGHRRRQFMLLLGLIGQGRSTHEWEAIAVGHYHLTRGAPSVKKQTAA